MLIGATALAVAAALFGVLVVTGLFHVGRSSTAHTIVDIEGAQLSAQANLSDDVNGTQVHFTGSGAVRDHKYTLWITSFDGRRLIAATFLGGPNGGFNLDGYAAVPYAQARRVWVTDDREHVVLDQSFVPEPN